MHFNTKDLIEAKREGEEIEMEDDAPLDRNDVAMQVLLAELVKAQNRMATLMEAVLARKQPVPQVNVSAPTVKVDAPKITVNPELKSSAKRYHCKHVYDRSGDIAETIITVDNK